MSFTNDQKQLLARYSPSYQRMMSGKFDAERKRQQDVSQAEQQSQWYRDNADTTLGNEQQQTGAFAEGVNPQERFMRQANFQRMSSGLPGINEQGGKRSESMQGNMMSGINSLNLQDNKQQFELSNPSRGSLPAAIKEYQFAQEQGYQGNFQAWKKLQKANGVSVTVGGQGAKPISSSDATKMVDQMGRPVKVPVGMTYPEARANGWNFGQIKTAEEIKAEASFGVSETMLDDMEELLASGADVSSWAGIAEKYRSDASPGGALVNTMMNAAGHKQNEGDIKLNTLSTALSNMIIAAFRGAQVGPEEQAMFERQLPIPGQPKEVYRNNLVQTRKNLKYLRQLRNEQSGTGPVQPQAPSAERQGAPSTPAVGEARGGYTFKGGDPSEQSNWEKI